VNEGKALDHILQAHREELAYCLFETAVTAEKSLRMGPWRLHDEDAQSASAEVRALPLEKLLGLAPEALHRELRDVPHAGSADRAINAQDIPAMLGACVRLVGRESARIHWALCLAFVGQPLARRRALEQLLETTRSDTHAAFAHQGLGVLHWMQGEPAKARLELLKAFGTSEGLRSAAALAVAVGWCVDGRQPLPALPAGIAEVMQMNGPVIARVAADVLRIVRDSGTTPLLEENLARRADEAPALATRIREGML